MCVFRTPFVLKVLPQLLQTKGRSDVCVLSCRAKLEGAGQTLEQYLQTFFFSMSLSLS